MALDFPNTPTLNQVFTAPNGAMWMWDGVKWTAIASVSQYAANTNVGRNLIHNPLFNVAQRGPGTFTANGYTADRWTIGFGNGSVTVSIAAQGDAARAQIGDEASTVVLMNTFTGSATVGSFTLLSQPIEGVRRLSGKTVTLSFWALATPGTLKIGVSMDQVFGSGGSPSAVVQGAGQSVTLSATWTRYSLTFTVPSTAGKTLGTNNNTDYTTMSFWYSAEATFAARSGNIGVQSGTIYLWGVQLEVGSVATPLEKPDPRYDLANCQRFYQAPAGAYLFGDNAGVASGAFYHSWMFPVTMRASPTMTLFGISGANSGGTAVNSQSASMFAVQTVPTAAGSSYTQFYITASADL